LNHRRRAPADLQSAQTAASSCRSVLDKRVSWAFADRAVRRRSMRAVRSLAVGLQSVCTLWSASTSLAGVSGKVWAGVVALPAWSPGRGAAGSAPLQDPDRPGPKCLLAESGSIGSSAALRAASAGAPSTASCLRPGRRRRPRVPPMVISLQLGSGASLTSPARPVRPQYLRRLIPSRCPPRSSSPAIRFPFARFTIANCAGDPGGFSRVAECLLGAVGTASAGV
jgi:hypothetical protein